MSQLDEHAPTHPLPAGWIVTKPESAKVILLRYRVVPFHPQTAEPTVVEEIVTEVVQAVQSPDVWLAQGSERLLEADHARGDRYVSEPSRPSP